MSQTNFYGVTLDWFESITASAAKRPTSEATKAEETVRYGSSVPNITSFGLGPWRTGAR